MPALSSTSTSLKSLDRRLSRADCPFSVPSTESPASSESLIRCTNAWPEVIYHAERIWTDGFNHGCFCHPALVKHPRHRHIELCLVMVKGQDSGSFPLVTKHLLRRRRRSQRSATMHAGVSRSEFGLPSSFLSNAGSVMRVTVCSHRQHRLSIPLSAKKQPLELSVTFRSSLTEMTEPVLNP